MSLKDLLLLYAVAGVACAIAVLRRAEGTRATALASACATLFVWPLWAPFALSVNGATAARQARAKRPTDNAAVARIERALADAVDAVAATPMSDIFSRQVAARISTEVGHVAARMDELALLEESRGFDAQASAKRVTDLEASGAPERAVATARMQHDNLVRLAKLRADDREALDELAELLEALRTQLLLARYAGSSAEGVGAIVGEVWARLEGLGTAFDTRSDAR